MQMLEYINDFDVDDENDTPVCVCPEYAGAQRPTFCKACGDWTDNIEIAKMEAAEEPAAVAVVAPVPEPETPRKPMANAHVAEPFRSILNSFAGCR